MKAIQYQAYGDYAENRLVDRLRVQRQWLWSYFTGQRSSRLIAEPSSYEAVVGSTLSSNGAPAQGRVNAQPANAEA